MSIKLMTAAWELPIKAGPKLVLLALCDFASDEGHCWPSVATIARKCGASERTVQEAIRYLISVGIVAQNLRSGTSAAYQVTPADFAPPQISHPRKNCTPPPQISHPTPAESAPKPSMNHQEPSKDNVDAERQPPLSVDEVVEAWNLTAERKGLRKAVKVTPQRRKQIQARIRQNTIDEWREALAAVERSSFCCGENDRGWRADLDFLLQPKSFTRLIEGFYDGAR